MLWQAKLHQQVFVLSMEDEMDARCFEVGGMIARDKGENGKRRGFASYPSQFDALSGRKEWWTSALVFE